MPEQDKSTSDLLTEVVHFKGNEIDKISLFEIKLALHERGFGILMLIFAFPLSIPLPTPPGYTTILSLPLFLFSYQLFMNFDSPILPKWLEKKSIKRKTLALIVEKTAPILKKIEKLMKPRLGFIFNSVGEKFIALISFFCTVSIAIPLPLIHFIPAAGISLMSLGLLSKDGLMVIIGMVVSLFGLFMTILIITVGPKIIVDMFSFLTNFL